MRLTSLAVAGDARLADEWRSRAKRLDDHGRQLRREGDSRAAEDAEAAAVDYRVAADDLEAGRTHSVRA